MIGWRYSGRDGGTSKGSEGELGWRGGFCRGRWWEDGLAIEKKSVGCVIGGEFNPCALDDPLAPPTHELHGSGGATVALDREVAEPPWARDGWRGEVGGAVVPDGRRFAALSSLPEGQRLPTRRDVPLAKHLRQDQRAAQEVREQEEVALRLRGPVTTPVLLPPAESRQLGFNCPACFMVLIIKDPATYDGRPAPCPTCGTRIQPPQCAPESPFSIVHREGVAMPPAGPRPEQELLG